MIKFVVLALVVTGIVFTILRLLKNARERHATASLVKKIEADPTQAQKLAIGLNYKYASFACSSSALFNEMIQHLQAGKEMGKFNLELVQPLPGSKYLLVTNCTDRDFDLNVTGRVGDAKKVYNLNFVVAFDQEKNELTVYSENYYAAQDKNLRTAFGSQLNRFFA